MGPDWTPEPAHSPLYHAPSFWTKKKNTFGHSAKNQDRASIPVVQGENEGFDEGDHMHVCIF